jgi:dienelactone hydrolase
MRFFFIVLLMVPVMSEAQQTVTFPSSDGLLITADLYLQDKSLPYIILYHQANFSRGEYKETAPKLMKLGYNCLAVDLRSGKEVNYIQNETAARAREKNLPIGYLDAEKDMLSAIEYVKKLTKEKIVLFGSSYSASLALKIAKGNNNVNAIVAFSPGEYFQQQLVLKTALVKLDKPIFIASTANEHPFIKEMMSGVSDNLITWWTPSKGPGTHGSKALWHASPGNDGCWMSLLMFFKGLKK